MLADDAYPTFSASDTGVLVSAPGRVPDEHFAWLDSRGAVHSTIDTSAELRPPANFDLSLDQRFLVVQQAGPNAALVLHDVARGVSTTLAVKGTDPVWSPDGKQIAWSIPAGPDRAIHIVPAFGGASRLLHTQADAVYLDDWSRDGQWLAGHVGAGGTGVHPPQRAGHRDAPPWKNGAA